MAKSAIYPAADVEMAEIGGKLSAHLPFSSIWAWMTPVVQKWGPVAAQGLLAVFALMTVAFAPPAHGRMLLIPLDGQQVSGATVASLGATPLLSGPLPGSLVIDGDRQPISMLWSQGILVLAAPNAICGGTEA